MRRLARSVASRRREGFLAEAVSRGSRLAAGPSLRPRNGRPDLRKGGCAALTILNMQVTNTLLMAQAAGTQIVMDCADPLGVAQWVRNESVNSWFGVPTILRDLVESSEVEPDDLHTLTDVWTGGTFLPETIRRSFSARFGHRISATYGLTEVPTIATIEERNGMQLPGSSGQALAHLCIEIHDDHDEVLPPNTVGEIAGPRRGRPLGTPVHSDARVPGPS